MCPGHTSPWRRAPCPCPAHASCLTAGCCGSAAFSSIALLPPKPRHSSRAHHHTRLASHETMCREGLGTAETEPSCQQGTGQALAATPAVSAAVAQPELMAEPGECTAEVTWSLHLKAQVPLPRSKASGHSHMRQPAPNWSQAPLPACRAAGRAHCAFVACPSATCRSWPL